jgi:hypothetical protein
MTRLLTASPRLRRTRQCHARRRADKREIAAGGLAVVARLELHDPIDVAVGMAAEHEGVNDAEDSGGGADS